ncbi:TIGR04283 family arsenosugar biosynthesis glycosyltransferase [uncultured Marinobacter sp.]|uniref:TIGR04283 family arsenosugar biosynthesis glycosyltransferase n=1 Tax=uncultured Marinobacter sp. TaxID=187379 RepID=UPI0030D83D18
MSGSVVVSVIIPVLQEAATIESLLRSLSCWRDLGHEVIVVDGGSADGTAELARPLCDRVVVSEKGRARQMNAGAAAARGDILLFLHADTQLPAAALDHLQAFAGSDRHWGRFDVRLSGQRPLFRLIALMMNSRSRLTGIATGDQAMFVRRQLFQDLGGFRNIALMEDIELSRQLLRAGRPFCIADPVVTDSRRWEQQGPWRTIVLMWRLRWKYWRGVSPDELARLYRADVRRGPS